MHGIVLYCPPITILYMYKSIKMKNEAKQLEIAMHKLVGVLDKYGGGGGGGGGGYVCP